MRESLPVYFHGSRLSDKDVPFALGIKKQASIV